MGGPPIGATTTRLNLATLGATVVATAAAAVWISTPVAIAAFTTGHFVWSTLLATRLLKDVARQ